MASFASMVFHGVNGKDSVTMVLELECVSRKVMVRRRSSLAFYKAKFLS